MAEERYLFDMRDTHFVLFEHLRAQRLFELELFTEFDRGDIELLLGEGVRFAQEVLGGCNEAGDREGCRFENGKVFVPTAFRQAYRQQCEAGWMAMSTPRKHGGQGLPFVFGAALGEAFVGSNCSLSMISGLTRAAATLIQAFGAESMLKLYSKPMLTGRWGGTMCLTEPHAGTALGSLTTQAEKRDGEYYVRGQKIFISGGDHDLVENVIHLVLARSPNGPPGTKGLSLFLIPKFLVNPDGSLGEHNDVVCTGIEKKLGIHGSPTCAMSFGDNNRCRAFLIGEENQGLELMFQMMNSARIGVGLQGVALGSAAYLFALDYARHRIQGAEMKNFRDPNAPLVPIIQHPDVRRMLATMKSCVEGGRALLLHTAMCLDLIENSPDPRERERLSGRVELVTPLCKAWCSDMGFEVATMALQTLGGHGYLKDYPIEQLLRDVKIASIYEGTNGIQAIDLLGRKIGRKQGALFMELMSELGNFLDANAKHPRLAAEMARLLEHKQKVEQITMSFAMSQMSGDMDYPLLCATPYLRMLGNLVVGWLLAEQAVVASEALERTYTEQGATTDAAQSELCREHTEARFYDNKVKSAQFFIHQRLIENAGIAAGIESGDRSSLEMNF